MALENLLGITDSAELACDMIKSISNMYNGNILLHKPYEGGDYLHIPQEIYSVLQISNGIEETMLEQKTNKRIPITWILYSYEQIIEESSFYKNEYGIDGVVFTDDGAGNPYILKSDGEIMCFNAIDNEESPVAKSLSDFYKNFLVAN